MNRLTMLGLVAVAALSGCVTVSYEELERVDQAAQGNRGYLVGEVPPVEASAEPATRTVTRVDVEMVGPKEAWQRWKGQSTDAPKTSEAPAPSSKAGAAVGQ